MKFMFFIKNKGKIALERIDFSNNSAVQGDGGAVFVQRSSGQILIKQCKLSENYASQNGGAVFASKLKEKIQFLNNSFEKNKAKGLGGAFCLFYVN